MIYIPMNDDIKVFNIKTFRDPLSNVIDMNYITYTKLNKFSSQRKKLSSLLTGKEDSDSIKIWNPRFVKR